LGLTLPHPAADVDSMRRHHARGHRGLALALIAFALLVSPASAIDFTATPGAAAPACCCAPEVAPPAGCCESEKATGDEVADEIRLSGMDCGCEAPSPAHPGEPAPAVCGTSFEVSIELHQRMHIAAWTPAAFAARDEVLVRGDELPPAAVLTEDQSVLHRRRARGTSLVLAVLSVARI